MVSLSNDLPCLMHHDPLLKILRVPRVIGVVSTMQWIKPKKSLAAPSSLSPFDKLRANVLPPNVLSKVEGQSQGERNLNQI